jgi:hypothetical protein
MWSRGRTYAARSETGEKRGTIVRVNVGGRHWVVVRLVDYGENIDKKE